LTVPGWAKDALWRNARAVPSLDLRFADNKSLVDAVTGASLVTFTRASSGTYVDSAGVLQTAAIDVPRFDHNPTTGESLGLLVEEQRTNLLLRSEEFDNASWGKSALTVTANSTTSPSQATTADKLIENGTTNEHYVRQTPVAYPTGATFSISIYVKSAERTSLRVRALDTVNSANGFFGSIDTATGTTGGAATGTGTFTSATAVNAGNGWWRLTIIGIASSTSTSCILDVFLLPGNANSASNYAGNGTSGIHVWGAQLEVGAFPSSYIPTTTAAATRSADVASITGSNFSSWYNQTEGTLFAEWFGGPVATNKFPSVAAARQVSSNNSQNTIEIFQGPSLTNVRANGLVRVSSVDQMSRDSGDLTLVGTKVKAALGVRTNDFVFMANGLQIGAVDTLGTLPTVDTFNIGFNSASEQLNGTIKRITYWPQALPSRLQTLTQ
jgi:hypothetical protein